MLEVGAEVTLEITDVALPSGFGVGRAGSMVVFVPGALIGDRVKVELVRGEKRFAYGRMTEIVQASPFREASACLYCAECGGCELQALGYEKQLEIKQNHLMQVLRRIGGADVGELPVSRIVPSVDRLYYRSKVEFAFRQRGGEVLIGFREREMPFRPYAGEVVPVADCCLFSPVVPMVLSVVRAFVRRSGLTAYDASTGKGILQRLVLREGKSTGELMVNVVSASDITSELKRLAEDLAGGVPSLKSFYGTTDNRPRLLSGKAYIEERLGSLTLRVYPLTFLQPNPRTAERLYETIVTRTPVGRDDRVLGLYCGAGAVELYLSRSAKEVRGIDASAQNIAGAKENAAINGIGNCAFIKGRVEDVLGRTPGSRPDLVVVDPPRAGLSREALKAVLKAGADRFAYISCNPSTLARDLKELRKDYAVREIIPFDFFPHTTHFEVLTLMEREERQRGRRGDWGTWRRSETKGFFTRMNADNYRITTDNVHHDPCQEL